MFLEALAQLRVGGVFDHRRQRLQDLVIGVIRVLQAMQEKVLQRFDVFGEKAHCVLLRWRESNDDGNSRFHRVRLRGETPTCCPGDDAWSGTAGWARTT